MKRLKRQIHGLRWKDVRGDIAAMSPKLAQKMREKSIAIDPEAPFIRRAMEFDPVQDMEFDPGEMAIVGRITSIERDLYDEVVLPEGMDAQVYSGIVLWNHDYWRDDVPHARNQWIKQNSTDPDNPGDSILAKTEYLPMTELGPKVYKYRAGNNPLGQSIGFWPTDWVEHGDKDWDKVYENWLKRYIKMKKARGAEKTDVDTSEPWVIWTEWLLMEYSDVLMPANQDAIAIAVSNGLIPSEDARGYYRHPDGHTDGQGDPMGDPDRDLHIPKIKPEEAEIEVNQERIQQLIRESMDQVQNELDISALRMALRESLS